VRNKDQEERSDGEQQVQRTHTYLAGAHGAVGEAEVHDLRELGELDIVKNDQGTVDGGDRTVLCRRNKERVEPT
jgi:hypothetical protein